MRKENQSFLWLYLFGLLTLCLPASTQAIALLSDEFKLSLPWVDYQGKNYSVTLSSVSDNALIFRFDEIAVRNDQAPPGALAIVSDDLEISLPLISFNGELYRANLRSDESGHFQILNATPIQTSNERGAVLSVELVETKTTNQIAAEYPFVALAGISLRYDVAVFRISYQTIDAFGNITSASGMIGVPLDIPGGVPLLSFQHGTITLRDNAPSANPEETGADVALYLMGASGYLTLVPDYLGFGDSNGLHPFMHAKTLAWTVIDLIRATRTLAAGNNYPLNGQLFLAGYSEGGYATMAAQKEIEIHHADELTITASSPMAGAYDLSGTMLQQFLSGEPLARPMYFPYVLLAYNTIYGFDESITNLLDADNTGDAIQLFDGAHDSDAINAALPSLPQELVTPEFFAALESGNDHPVRTALENNDVYRWQPTSPTRLYHCQDDERVPLANSTVAHDYFINAGADVELEILSFGNHIDCAVPALLRGKSWFDTLAELP